MQTAYTAFTSLHGQDYIGIDTRKRYCDVVLDTEHCAIYHIRTEDELTSAVGTIIDYDNSAALIFFQTAHPTMNFGGGLGHVALINPDSIVNLVQKRSEEELYTTAANIFDAFGITDPSLYPFLLNKLEDYSVRNSERTVIGTIKHYPNGLLYTPRKIAKVKPQPDYGFDPYRFKQFQQVCQLVLAEKMQVQRISFTTVLRSYQLVKKNFNTMVKVCTDHGITFDQIAQHYTTIRSSAFEPLIEKYWNEALAVNK